MTDHKRRNRNLSVALALATIIALGWLYRNTAIFAPVSPPDFQYQRRPTSETDKLLVFIHGFGSNSTDAWTHSSGAYWPALVEADPELQEFAVATVRFGSPLIRRTVTVEEASTAVGSALESSGIFSRFAQIAFIAHSTGGIVLRRVLNRLQSQGQTQALQRVSTVVFFATPTSGAPIADLARWLSANPQLKDLSPSEMQSYLGAVDNDWEDLLRRRDREGRTRPLVYCAYEVLDTAIGPIVPALYSRTRCDDTPRPFEDRDHMSLVKPANNSDDNVYVWTKSKLKGVRARSGQVIWDGGELLGDVVSRLQEGFDNGRVPERVRIAPGAQELLRLWIPGAPYKRDTWGELFEAVAATNECLDVRVTAPGVEVELGVRQPMRRCARRGQFWRVCASATCADGPVAAR